MVPHIVTPQQSAASSVIVDHGTPQENVSSTPSSSNKYPPRVIVDDESPIGSRKQSRRTGIPLIDDDDSTSTDVPTISDDLDVEVKAKETQSYKGYR